MRERRVGQRGVRGGRERRLRLPAGEEGAREAREAGGARDARGVWNERRLRLQAPGEQSLNPIPYTLDPCEVASSLRRTRSFKF